MIPILLIEDDQRIAALTKKELGEQGFGVTPAIDGETGAMVLLLAMGN